MPLLPRGAATDRSAFHNEAQLQQALAQQSQRLGVYGELEGPQGMAQLRQAAQGLSAAASAPELARAEQANAFAADAIARLKLDTGLKNPEALAGSQALYQMAVAKGLMSPDGRLS